MARLSYDIEFVSHKRIHSLLIISKNSPLNAVHLGQLGAGVPRRRVRAGAVAIELDKDRSVTRTPLLPNETEWAGADRFFDLSVRIRLRNTLRDVAPNFYPAVSSFWRLDLPCRACWAAGADAEPFMLRSV